jgi:hypothetical protein
VQGAKSKVQSGRWKRTKSHTGVSNRGLIVMESLATNGDSWKVRRSAAKGGTDNLLGNLLLSGCMLM